MYCVQCGVELKQGTKSCPLCNTEVAHPLANAPAVERMYPPKEPQVERFSPGGILFVITSLVLLAAIISMLCDLGINAEVTWSGFVVGGLCIGYSAVILPNWFRRPNPVIFFPVFFAVCICFLLYVDLSLNGGWFLSFAFPVAGGISLLVCSIVTLIRFLKRGRLIVFGGALVLLGVFFLLVEFLSDLTFSRQGGYQWAFYPLVILCFLGACLLTVAFCKPLKDSLAKRLFL